MAIMNEHPTMNYTTSIVSFCRAPETSYPPIGTLFTTRIIEPLPDTHVKSVDGDEKGSLPSWVRTRPHWRRECAGGAPTPEQLYDALVEFGPIHHVEVIAGIHKTRYNSPWEATVQFWSPESADKLDDVPGSRLFGWKV